MITKQSYEDLKPYWDFQRKKEYNKEKLEHLADKMQGQVYDQFGPISGKELLDTLWCKLPQEAYEDPHPGWVPRDKSYRLEWEKEPGPVQIPYVKKGKPVVVKAKWLHNQLRPIRKPPWEDMDNSPFDD
tara:strand:+ start:681 stop:1067 length:387 start_codon:yes stop_codon:yes gene_type:complete